MNSSFRAQFEQLLAANKNLSVSRYFRLMGLAGLEVILTVPLACVSVWLNKVEGGIF